MNEIKPWSVLLILGGLGMVLSSFVGWAEVPNGAQLVSENAWDMGMLGLYQTIIGVGVALYGLAQMVGKKFGQQVGPLTINQWAFLFSVAVALWGFAFVFDDNPQFGVLTTWVSGAVAAVGTLMNDRAEKALDSGL